MKTKLTLMFCSVLSGCAQLHQIQISDIDQTKPLGQRFEVKASSMGLDLSEAGALARAFSARKTTARIGGSSLQAAWELITYGPRTGDVTFNTDYADELPKALVKACPGSEIALLSSIRESMHYPIISGEIVRFVGYCSDVKEKTKI